VNEDFPTKLATHILSTMEAPLVQSDGQSSADLASEKQHPSYRWSLAVWLVNIWSDAEYPMPKEEKSRIWRELLASLIHGDPVLVVSYPLFDVFAHDFSLMKLRDALIAVDPSLRGRHLNLAALLPSSQPMEEDSLHGLEDTAEAVEEDHESQLEAMERRLIELQTRVSFSFKTVDMG
jgi:hypothetical protein